MRLLQEFREAYKTDKRKVDALLLTATVWDVDLLNEGIPMSGQVVKISKWSRLKVFNKSAVQLSTKIGDFAVE